MIATRPAIPASTAALAAPAGKDKPGFKYQYGTLNDDGSITITRVELENGTSLVILGQGITKIVGPDKQVSGYEVDLVEFAKGERGEARTAASRKLQQETLKSESEKFRVGQSTTFLVAQAQRDLLRAQINEIDAVVTYRKALVEIYRLEGSLLQRRGIAAPGATPPDAPHSGR